MNNKDTKVEVIFRNDLNAKNKLITFIIDKILEDYDKLGGVLDGNNNTRQGRNDEKIN